MANLKAGTVEYDITVNTKGIEKAKKKVESSSSKMAGAVKKIGAAFALYVGFQQAKEIVMLADSMRVLESRLRAATKSQQEFNKVQANLTSISRANGIAIESTIDLYTQLNDSVRNLGASTDQITQLIDSVQKLGKIGGSTQEDLGRSLFQFNQALSGGVFRAEEFNSILDATPKIIDAIAAGMAETAGKTSMSRGELRQMMLDGRLYADDVLKAILGQTEKISENYEKIRKSASDAATGLTNELKILVLNLDKELGITELIASVTNNITDLIKEQNDKYTEQGKLKSEIQDNTEEILALEKEIRLLNDLALRQGAELQGDKALQLSLAKESLQALKEQNAVLDNQIAKINERNAIEASDQKNIIDKDRMKKEIEAEEAHWDGLNKIAQDYRQREVDEAAELNQLYIDEINETRQQEEEARMAALASTEQFLGNMNQLFAMAGKEHTAIAKLAFLSQKAIALTTMTMNAFKTASEFPEPYASVVRGMALANVGIVAGMSVGEVTGAGRQQGGRISPNLVHPINEGGKSEVFQTQAGRQYLMSAEGGQMIPLHKFASDQTSATPQISVSVYNETGVMADATATYVTPTQLEVRLKKHQVDINRNLALQVRSNTGDVMNALNQTTNIQRQRNA